ncbi:MAG: NAD-dependent epimerase/dehydratase family protein [Planctomycetia bacterium]|nr:NAD-dependent epimerase/dehydratase family protein [Planctomycetia bacterium]
MNTKSKIYLAGHDGMVGSAILNELHSKGYKNIVIRTLSELDLRRQMDVEKFINKEKPDIIIIAAARVGGIVANNTYRAEFLYDNIMIEANIIQAAHQINVEKLLFLGSSCIYPKDAQQPLKEEYLLTNILEPTNEPYAVAKIAGIKLCENYYRQYGDNFFSVMPTNLYGPYDNFNLQTSHVLPALIRKFHEAKIQNSPTVTVWGTGEVYREFLYVQDMANACVELLTSINAEDIYSQGISHINIGTGKDITISDLAYLVSDIVQFSGKIIYDDSKPDGVYKKLLDVTRLHQFGWREKISLREGIEKAYKWFLDNYK